MTDPLVERVVRRIAEAIRPEKIILFGSRARGTARPDSDIDLLVVHASAQNRRELQMRIHNLFEHPDFSMDLFVMTPEELASQRRIANTLAREVSEHGVVCYGWRQGHLYSALVNQGGKRFAFGSFDLGSGAACDRYGMFSCPAMC